MLASPQPSGDRSLPGGLTVASSPRGTGGEGNGPPVHPRVHRLPLSCSPRLRALLHGGAASPPTPTPHRNTRVRIRTEKQGAISGAHVRRHMRSFPGDSPV